MLLDKINLLMMSIILMTFLVIFILGNISAEKISRRLFVRIVLATLLVLLVALGAVLVNGRNTEFFEGANLVFVTLIYLFYPLPLMAWIYYLQFKLFHSVVRARNAMWIVAVPYVVVLTMIIFNWSTGYFYFFDSMNYFHKGNYYIYMEMVICLPVFTYIAYLFLNSRQLKSDVLSSIATLFIIPVVTMLVQHFTNSIYLIWPSLSVVTIMVYILVETDELKRDFLTGLYSKGAFVKKTKSYLKHQIPFTIIMVDIDDFKCVNDTFGHPVGDQALNVVASILSSNVKHDDLVFRIGGDEFAVILSNSTPDTFEKVKGRLLSEIQNYNRKKLVPYYLSISIGGCFISKRNQLTYEEIIENADGKLYCDKLNKSNH